MTTDMRNRIYTLRRFLLWFCTLGGTSGIVYNLNDCNDETCEDIHDDEFDPAFDGICDEEDADDYYEDY